MKKSKVKVWWNLMKETYKYTFLVSFITGFFYGILIAITNFKSKHTGA